MLVMIPPEDLIPVLQAKVARENAKGGLQLRWIQKA
jgi:hypothetical protein